MQKIIFDEPYEFIPPLDSKIWPRIFRTYISRYLRKVWSVDSYEFRHAERLKESLAAGHGILLAPNHCRLCDPLVLGRMAACDLDTNLFAMASWHLFKQDWFTSFMIRRMGAFSVYREGMDRAAINASVEILAQAQRPLIIFPEGATSRHNDILMALMDGTAVIARSAAKRRAKQTPPGKVVVHPVAIRYFFRGDLEAAAEPSLANIEHRLTWQSQKGTPLVYRLRHIGSALLALKEVEYFGVPHSGDLYERVTRLIDRLLMPLEEEWKVGDQEENVVGRVKRLRAAILPDLVNGEISEEERERRWRQLNDVYLAQQLAAYPRDYLHRSGNLPERLLETLERFEEDLLNEINYHGPMHVVVQMGESIEVHPARVRKGLPDPVMLGIETQLETMLAELATESAPV